MAAEDEFPLPTSNSETFANEHVPFHTLIDTYKPEPDFGVFNERVYYYDMDKMSYLYKIGEVTSEEYFTYLTDVYETNKTHFFGLISQTCKPNQVKFIITQMNIFYRLRAIAAEANAAAQSS